MYIHNFIHSFEKLIRSSAVLFYKQTKNTEVYLSEFNPAMADSTDTELDIELLERSNAEERSKAEEILKEKTKNRNWPLWRKRALRTFKAAWQKSKATVIWAIIKLVIKIVMLYAFSVVLCTMDTLSDFALSDKYFKFVLHFFKENVSLHFSTFL